MKFYENLLCLVLKLAFLYPLIEKRTIKFVDFLTRKLQMNLSLTQRRNYFKFIDMAASQLLTMQLLTTQLLTTVASQLLQKSDLICC